MKPINDAAAPCLFTVGHSNHALEVFVALLKRHEIQVLADIRSSPYSRYVTHFDREVLEDAVKQAGVNYLYLGKELGGRPDGAEFYDAEGHVLYYRLAEAPLFLDGIKRLEAGVRRYRVAVMCSEENPCVCHRHLLVGRVISRRGVAIEHIRGDGALVPNAALQEAGFVQPTLFDPPEETTWKSLRSVLPKKTPSSSSASSDATAFDDSSMSD